MSIDKIRREYLIAELRRGDLNPDPMVQFQQWLDGAVAEELIDATAMTVATVSEQGQPSTRIVLLKQVGAEGFVFFTNSGSRKATELAGNKKVSAHFYWSALERQVKICGHAQQVSAEMAGEYFVSRPIDSQFATWASPQSQVVDNKEYLNLEVERVQKEFAGQSVTPPPFWVGYRIVPEEIEFWQGGENRLHDRFIYRRSEDQDWVINRLAP